MMGLDKKVNIFVLFLRRAWEECVCIKERTVFVYFLFGGKRIAVPF